MPDRRFIGDFESLLRFVRRSFLEAAIARQPVLGGVGVTFGNVPDEDVIPGVIVIDVFKGLVAVPRSDEAPAGWGFPYDLNGTPIDPPRGTVGGTHPEGIFSIDSNTNSAVITRSDEWFPAMGDRSMSAMVGGADWQRGPDGSVTWNDSDKHPSIVLSNGDLTVGTSGGIGWRSVRAKENPLLDGAKWYYEVTIDAQTGTDGTMVGVSDITADISFLGTTIGSDSNSVGYESDGSIVSGGITTDTVSSYAVGDVIMIAYDVDSGDVWVGKNGVWQNSGDPVAGTGSVATGLSGDIVPGVSIETSTSSNTASFGTDTTTYEVPTGFLAYNNSNLILSYGSIGNTRYQKTYVTQIFKESILIGLTPSPVGMTAVAAEISDNSILVAAISSGVFTIRKYYMTDSTLLIQDTGTASVQLVSYSLTNITANDLDVSVETGGEITNIPSRDTDMDLVSCNFSPQADACVFTTNYGDLVEFSISGLSATVNEEIIIRQPQDSYFMSADLSGSFTVDTTETFTFVERVFNHDIPIGGGVSRQVSVFCVYDRTSETITGTEELSKSYKQFTLISDYDFNSNQRVDLHYDVSGSRARTKDDRSGTGYTVERLCVYNSVTEPPCDPPACPVDPSGLGSNSGDVFDIVDNSYAGVSIALKLGTEVLETFTHTNINLQSEVSVDSVEVITDSKTGNAKRLQKIHAADLRIGFVAYEYTDESYEETHIVVDGSPTVDVEPTINGTLYHKVHGGDLLQDQTFSDGYVEDVGTATFDRQISLEIDRNDDVVPPIAENNWRFGYTYTAFEADPETAFYPVYSTKTLRDEISTPISYEDTVDLIDSVTLSNQIGFRQPDMALADTEFIDRDSVLQERYTDFSKGDEVTIAEITGTNPRATPKGVI